MARTHDGSTGSNLAVLQRTSRVRAPSIEDIDAVVNVRDADQTAEDLVHLNLSRDNLALPHQPMPFQRKHIIKTPAEALIKYPR